MQQNIQNLKIVGLQVIFGESLTENIKCLAELFSYVIAFLGE